MGGFWQNLQKKSTNLPKNITKNPKNQQKNHYPCVMMIKMFFDKNDQHLQNILQQNRPKLCQYATIPAF